MKRVTIVIIVCIIGLAAVFAAFGFMAAKEAKETKDIVDAIDTTDLVAYNSEDENIQAAGLEDGFGIQLIKDVITNLHNQKRGVYECYTFIDNTETHTCDVLQCESSMVANIQTGDRLYYLKDHTGKDTSVGEDGEFIGMYNLNTPEVCYTPVEGGFLKSEVENGINITDVLDILSEEDFTECLVYDTPIKEFGEEEGAESAYYTVVTAYPVTAEKEDKTTDDLVCYLSVTIEKESKLPVTFMCELANEGDVELTVGSDNNVVGDADVLLVYYIMKFDDDPEGSLADIVIKEDDNIVSLDDYMESINERDN